MTTTTRSDTAQTALRADRTRRLPAWSGPTRARAHTRAREESAVPDAPPAVTVRSPRRGWVGRLWRELTPPQPWTHRPAALASVWRYATRGGWAPPASPARRLMVAWYLAVTLPVTVVCHYTAWLVARPSRALTAGAAALVVWQAVRA